MKANPLISKSTVSFLCVGMLLLTIIASAGAADSSAINSTNISATAAPDSKPTADSKSAWETFSFKAAVFSAIFTSLAAICAGVWAVVVWKREATWRRQDHAAELNQRKEELRWKQAELARQLLDEIFDFAPSGNAWDMVDGITEFKDNDGQKFEVSEAGIQRALELIMVDGKPVLRDSRGERERREERFIRDCFDALFYYIERLERSLRIPVVNFDDLAAPSGYYINLMAAKKKLFKEYAQFIGFNGAVTFMDRFPEWLNKKA